MKYLGVVALNSRSHFMNRRSSMNKYWETKVKFPWLGTSSLNVRPNILKSKLLPSILRYCWSRPCLWSRARSGPSTRRSGWASTGSRWPRWLLALLSRRSWGCPTHSGDSYSSSMHSHYSLTSATVDLRLQWSSSKFPALVFVCSVDKSPLPIVGEAERGRDDGER